MAWINWLLDIFLHLDTHLSDLAVTLGPWLYVVVFLIVFCETGLVVTPILPGDSLLFALGALAARPEFGLNLSLLLILLIVAAVTGDAVNYALGYQIGPKVFKSEESRLLNRKHLVRTQRFYERHGGKTIIFARFIPIIRTFAPFVAGIGKMEYRRFSAYNVAGGIAWVLTFLVGGYWVGNVPTIKTNFHYVIVAIIVVSVMPAVIDLLLRFRAPVEEPVAAEAK